MSIITATGTAFEDQSVIVLARVVGADAANIVQADVSTITYAVYDTTDGTATVSSTSLTVSDVIFDSLQTDSRWTEDSTGYNFRHTVAPAAFPNGNRIYQVEYKLTLSGSEVEWVTAQITTKELFTS